MNISDLINDLDLGEYGQDFVDDYDLDIVENSYIDDLIFEFADNKAASSSFYDTKEFFADHADEIDDVINEFGWDGVGRSVYKAAAMTEVILIERDLRDHEEDILKYMGYTNASEKYNSEEIPDEIVNAIDNACSNYPQVFRQILNAIDGPEDDEEESEE